MNKKQNATASNKVLTIIGIVLCVILIPILIVNCTLLLKSFFNKDEVPDFGGVMPLIVLTDSMYPEIQGGDLILCRSISAEEVTEGDIISFFDPVGNGNTVVTHQVIEITEEDGALSFRTKGTNNNTADKESVPAENVIGKYTGLRIPRAGSIAMFVQSSTGLLICILIPLVCLLGFDWIRRRTYEKKKKSDMAALMQELETLRAANATEKVTDTSTSPETMSEDFSER